MSHVGFIGHNLGTAGTWRIRLSTADATALVGDANDIAASSTGVFPDTLTAVQRATPQPFGRAHSFFAVVAGRYLRLNFSDTRLAHIQGGRLVCMPRGSLHAASA